MKIDTNKSGSQVGSWVKKALYGSAVLGLAMTLGMQSAVAAGSGMNEGFPTITPFSRVATLAAVRDAEGEVDHVATYKEARAVSLAIATFVARTKEGADDQTLIDLGVGPAVILGKDWKLGGTDKTCLETQVCSDEMINHNVIAIPSPEPIDPNDPAYVADGTVTKTNTKKGNVIEFCNKKYASMAMGVPGDGDILPGRTIVNGFAHAPALPCEVSVWNDAENIYIDMLDPSAIFTLFFSDVHFSDDMQDPEFAAALNAMPPQVKDEIVATIYAALQANGYSYAEMDQQVGPEYSSLKDIIKVVKSSPLDSPYLHMVYTKQDGDDFNASDSKLVAQTIINTMSKHGVAGAGTHDTVINEDGDTLDSILSPKSSWRSARLAPISIPGANHIIEACSPLYAKMAMSTGLHHVNALPCEITVKLIDNNTKMVISYLDPAFMLGALFADISKADQKAFGDIPDLINTDLQNIVKAALEVNLDESVISGLNAPTRMVINMLPSEDDQGDGEQ